MTINSLTKLIFSKQKNGAERTVTLFNCFRFRYSKPSNDAALKLKSVWERVQNRHLDAFKKSALVRELNNESLCIDCGANVGAIAEVFASKGATVHCFEPQAQCCEILLNKFRDNRKVYVHQAAVLDRPTRLKLYKCKHHASDIIFSQASSAFPSNTEIDEHSFEEVEAIDLIDFINSLGRNVDVLKLDIEGAEFAVLSRLIESGAHTRIKHILVETHDASIPELKQPAEEVRRKIAEQNITNIDLSWV